MNARPRLPIRGGNWNNGSNAGLASLNLNNSRWNANSNIGFRPALDNVRSCDSKECSQYSLEKDATTSALAEIKMKPVDASIGCTYENIFSFENILSAAYSCRKGRAKTEQALKFFENLEENVIEIQNQLVWGEYVPSKPRVFYVFEPKRRLIAAPIFKDRVIHRAIYNILEPEFDKTYIYDSYACRKNKGTHKGMRRAKSFIRSITGAGEKAYALKADISKYFSSINHMALKEILSKKIKCKRTLGLLNLIVDESYSDYEGVGIPLGNLTSQMFANIYLHELDVFVKHTLREKLYMRYMDDFIILGTDKKKLRECQGLIDEFLSRRLMLVTNSRTQIFPIAREGGRALDFLGYRIYSNKVLLRKNSIKNISKRPKRLQQKYYEGEIGAEDVRPYIHSWLGHAKHADSDAIAKKILSIKFKRKANV